MKYNICKTQQTTQKSAAIKLVEILMLDTP